MIRSIAVRTGEGQFIEAAQKHALTLAKLFAARLRAVAFWDARHLKAARQSAKSLNLEQVARQEAEHLLKRALQDRITASAHLRAEGLDTGMRAEARACDLMVFGWPPNARVVRAQPLARALLRCERSLLRRVEASILVVSRPPKKFRNILVKYEEGMEGKTALRLAAHLAERARASVHVLSLDANITRAQLLVATAEEYLRAFRLPSVRTIPWKGSGTSKPVVLRTAHESAADLIVIGSNPYGLVERLIGGAASERITFSTDRPVLIAR